MDSRMKMNQDLFLSKKWETNAFNKRTGFQTYVFDRCMELIDRFSWNKNETVPIIPAVHGTQVKRCGISLPKQIVPPLFL